MSIGTDGMLYYHTINMDQNNGRGDVSSKNQLLDMANADYKDLMLAVEDPEAGLNHLYAARGTADLDGAAAGELEVLRYSFKGEIDGPMSYRGLFGYTNSFGLSDMQLSPGRKHLLVYNLTGLPEGFTGARTAEVYIYRLDDAYEPVDETPQHIDLPEGTTPNSSAVFMEDNQTAVISTRSVSGDRLLGHNLAENTTTIAVEGTAGTLTTGRDGRLYVSPAGTTTTLAYESDMSPATGWTYDHTLTGIRSFTAYKALDKGATGSVLASRRVGFKTYELKDLPITIGMGNVRVLVSDRVKAVSDGNGGTFTDALVQAFNNYYPFGMLQTQRSQSAIEYRFGFNGMEKDDEIKGTGNSYDFGARIYDSRVGRWLSVDPSQAKYPHLSPYNSFENNPVYFNDPDGKDARITIDEGNKTITVSTVIYIYGSGATAERAVEMQKNIMDVWKGDYTYSDSETGEVYNVKFKVAVRKYKENNPTYIWGVFDSDDINNYIRVENTGGISHVKGEGAFQLNPRIRGTGVWKEMKTGIWYDYYSDGSGSIFKFDPSYHEIAHLFGLSDRYDEYYDENGVRQGNTHKGYESNIMGQGKEIYQEDIDAIVGNAVKEYNSSFEGWWNNCSFCPGYKVFQYHQSEKDHEPKEYDETAKDDDQ